MINANITLGEWLNSLRGESDALHARLMGNDDYRRKLEIDMLISQVEQYAQFAGKPVRASESPASTTLPPSTGLFAQERVSEDAGGIPQSLVGLPRTHAVIEILRRGRHALTTRQVVERLRDEGFDLSGNGPTMVSNSLGRLQGQGVVKKQRTSSGKNGWALNDSEKAKERLAKILTMPRAANGERGGRLTYGDVAYETLKKAGHKLPIMEIMKAVNAAGMYPTRQTLSSGLVRDGKNRFTNLGSNVFALTEWESGQARVA